jgi:hypothetical protein
MKEQVVIFHRSVHPERLSKAVAFTLLAINTIGAATLLLCVTEGALLAKGMDHLACSLRLFQRSALLACPQALPRSSAPAAN